MRAQILYSIGALLAFAPEAMAEPPSNSVTLTEVFFRFDSSELDDKSKSKLAGAADEVNASLGQKIVIEGHADPRGTSPYNVGLAIRRAEAVRDDLMSRGADRDQIVLVTYGEDGKDRSSYAEERRVTVSVTGSPLHAIVDQALPEATALTWGKPATISEIYGPERDRVSDEIARR